ncbi:hypothetical protein VNO77_23437 [Canavalia gladiata]|uniref:Uncharacterized protein n=1 Tax=Canavalia gladiata TaxID=3824 RepID=A0AAN9QBP6_CANGL
MFIVRNSYSCEDRSSTPNVHNTSLVKNQTAENKHKDSEIVPEREMSLKRESYEDGTLIMQFLCNELTLWTLDMQDTDANGIKEAPHNTAN